jgi:hypothetical protein
MPPAIPMSIGPKARKTLHLQLTLEPLRARRRKPVNMEYLLFLFRLTTCSMGARVLHMSNKMSPLHSTPIDAANWPANAACPPPILGMSSCARHGSIALTGRTLFGQFCGLPESENA